MKKKNKIKKEKKLNHHKIWKKCIKISTKSRPKIETKDEKIKHFHPDTIQQLRVSGAIPLESV